MEAGTFRALLDIHKHLFQDIYTFAGEIRQFNISKGDFKFAAAKHLPDTLKSIDRMPQKSFENVAEKYIEMNIAHPFLEGNGRATRIWLDHMLKKELNLVVDWSKVSKHHYLAAMIDSPVNDSPLKELLNRSLTRETESRSMFMKGLDASYDYEGLNKYKSEELSPTPEKKTDRQTESPTPPRRKR